MISQNSHHLFFCYARVDADRMYPIHSRLQLLTEHYIWIDESGIERGTEWEKEIRLAIDTSYGVIFAVTRPFLTRPFILDKEIPWAFQRFNNRQGKQLFVLLFDDITVEELPILLRENSAVTWIYPVGKDTDAIYNELKSVLPYVNRVNHIFVVSWPRLANFKGRDSTLLELHEKLTTDQGHISIQTAGLYGMGGIGKTQLAVEYAYRFRYYYGEGVFWINAAADWREEFANCAKRAGITAHEAIDQREELILSLEAQLRRSEAKTLIIMDNVRDPTQIATREIGPKLTVQSLCAQTGVRLIITTRVLKLPVGFQKLSVDVLKPADARAVLAEAWNNKVRTDSFDVASIDRLAQRLGYLPLALGWMAVTLQIRRDLTPDMLLEELEARGLDALIIDLQEAEIELGTPENHDKLVSVALNWQLEQLSALGAKTVLALIAAYGEAAVVPTERIRLLADLQQTRIIDRFQLAVNDLRNYCLIEVLQEGAAFRLHPLVQQFITAMLNAEFVLRGACKHLVAAFYDPATLESHLIRRGFSAVRTDLIETQRVLSLTDPALDALSRLLTLCEGHLRELPPNTDGVYVIQQVRDRAYHEGYEDLRLLCDKWLEGKVHFSDFARSKKKSSASLIRKLEGHEFDVFGVSILSDGRLLSWAGDGTLRVWSSLGDRQNVFGHNKGEIGGVLLLEGDLILCWTDDVLEIWSPEGDFIRELNGHLNEVVGACLLADGRILSWSIDNYLCLWSPSGVLLKSMQGHEAAVQGGLELSDGLLISWSEDGTIRFWNEDGTPLSKLDGVGTHVDHLLQVSDNFFVSWPHSWSMGFGPLVFWHTDEKEPTRIFAHRQGINGAAALSDRRIITWGMDGLIRIWNNELKIEGQFQHNASVTGLTELSEGRILSWSSDGTWRIWCTDTGEELVSATHDGAISGVMKLSDGNILSWSSDGTLRLWDLQGNVLAVFDSQGEHVSGALELSNSRFISWSEEGTMRLWQMGEVELSLTAGHNSAPLLRWLSNNTIISAAGNTVCMWSLEGELLKHYISELSSIWDIVELENGGLVAGSKTGQLEFSNLMDNQIKIVGGHTSYIDGLIELRNGNLLTWSRDKTLRIWSNSGIPRRILRMKRYPVRGAIELTDSRILTWSDERSMRLWTSETKFIRKFEGHRRTIIGAVELANHSILSWSQDGTLRIWHPDANSPLLVLKGHDEPVWRADQLKDNHIMSFSPQSIRLWDLAGDQQLVIETPSQYGFMSVLEMTGGQIVAHTSDFLGIWSREGSCLAELKGHTADIMGIIALENDQLLSWSIDGTLRLWNLGGVTIGVFKMDTMPEYVLPLGEEKLIVADQSGRIAFLQHKAD